VLWISYPPHDLSQIEGLFNVKVLSLSEGNPQLQVWEHFANGIFCIVIQHFDIAFCGEDVSNLASLTNQVNALQPPSG
jgi:hypothetical protein